VSVVKAPFDDSNGSSPASAETRSPASLYAFGEISLTRLLNPGLTDTTAAVRFVNENLGYEPGPHDPGRADYATALQVASVTGTHGIGATAAWAALCTEARNAVTGAAVCLLPDSGTLESAPAPILHDLAERLSAHPGIGPLTPE
jgi:hypothetical protein